jgi:DNA-binding NtrC family response regulator
MPGVLRVLLVEDSEDDAALLVHEPRKGGYRPQSQRVDSAVDLAEALAQDNWDLVITDHNLPAFSSAAALGMVKDSGLDIPIIIVSGSIGEDVAVAAMKEGAHDYIMKESWRGWFRPSTASYARPRTAAHTDRRRPHSSTSRFTMH